MFLSVFAIILCCDLNDRWVSLWSVIRPVLYNLGPLLLFTHNNREKQQYQQKMTRYRAQCHKITSSNNTTTNNNKNVDNKAINTQVLSTKVKMSRKTNNNNNNKNTHDVNISTTSSLSKGNRKTTTTKNNKQTTMPKAPIKPASLKIAGFLHSSWNVMMLVGIGDLSNIAKHHCQGAGNTKMNAAGIAYDIPSVGHELSSIRGNSPNNPVSVCMADFMSKQCRFHFKNEKLNNGTQIFTNDCMDIICNNTLCHRYFNINKNDMNDRYMKAMNAMVDQLKIEFKKYFESDLTLQFFQNVVFLYDPKQYSNVKFIFNSERNNIRLKALLAFVNGNEWGFIDGDALKKEFGSLSGAMIDYSKDETWKKDVDLENHSHRFEAFWQYFATDFMFSSKYPTTIRLIAMFLALYVDITPNERTHGRRRMIRTKQRRKMTLDHEREQLEVWENLSHPLNEETLSTFAVAYSEKEKEKEKTNNKSGGDASGSEDDDLQIISASNGRGTNEL